MAGNAEIDLPASPYRLLNALDEIGIKSTKEIVYQEILNYGSFGYLEPHFDEYTMLEELNTLAQKLAVFDRVDSIAFEGLVKMAEQKPEPFGVKELINFAHSTESCHVVSDVFDDEQLGRFYAGNGFSQGGTWREMITKETFVKALQLIQEQQEINHQFAKALDLVGDGHYVFGVNNKFYDAAMLVLKEAVNDKYDYISWWLYEGEPDYKVWSSDNTEEWNLTEPEALYDFIVNECQE